MPCPVAAAGLRAGGIPCCCCCCCCSARRLCGCGAHARSGSSWV
jgi:hypothetical protein